ncbi:MULTISPECIES: hypothetical protein [unclassified Shewanella]|uniref:hypothetical protein n=1 Tax=Shewanella TaxID=22 RepID=UPI002628B26D|nr:MULTISPECIES: hypothetical protein [unclassified Shewanella]MDT3306290.1 hypothetical protein [Shewanella sp. SP1S1-4]
MAGKNKASLKSLFKIETQEQCLSAIKNGWIVTLISLSITLVFSTIGFFTQTENATLNYFLDPFLMIDVVLMAVMAFFIYRKSRIAATLMLFYFVLSKILQWSDLGNVQGLPLAIVFMFFYFNAMRATFVWHSKYKIVDESLSLDTDI